MRRELTVDLGPRSYEIIVDEGLLAESGRLTAQALAPAKSVTIITNTAVGALYGREVVSQARAAGLEVNVIEVPVGERQKSLSRAGKIFGRLLELGANRNSAIIALGGGVIGDLAGFVAATFMRGIPFVQIPTTLLAQVDSSVGGKTAVNHPSAKNIIGSFHQPRLVLIDTTVLKSLPGRQLRAGLSEVIKYGFIAGEPLLGEISASLAGGADRSKLAPIIVKCCAYKAAVVEKDEKDTGRRAILNYGHTIGHAIEAVAGYRRVNHGEAIAIGMVGAAEIAGGLGLLSREEVRAHREILTAAGLPTGIENIDMKMVYDHLRLDKKRVAKSDRMVLLDGIGKPEVHDVDGAVIKKVLSGLPEKRRSR